MGHARSLMGSVLLLGAIGAGWAAAPPALAQALGDADCPGGYYYYPAYNMCVPYGSVYAPNYAPDYGYDYPPPFYGYGPYVVIQPQRRDRDDRRRFDRDRDRH
jgi:hypothetical protein